LERVVAGVRDRADAHGIAHDVLESLSLVVLGVELGEALDVGARAERALRVGRRGVRVGAVLESVEPLEDVARPTDRLAELAIADEIDPDLGLLPHDVADRPGEQRLELLVADGVGVTGAPGFHRRDQTVRTYQTADMGREDPIDAAS
jgi:hypothetical protein